MSDRCRSQEYTKQYFARIATEDKRLHWIDTDLQSPFHQFSFYDQEAEVTELLEQAKQWFTAKL